jgi:crotonobetainyl-CoA:carnitine CoA-transferase CaiB-like acyl-CoA transferase
VPVSALTGIRVLDLTRILAGPWCTMTLADLGAEVWKIEPPGSGDDTRHWSPPETGGVSTYYLTVNRSKKSVAIDLNRPAGRRLLLGLAAKADVVIENYRPATLRRWGFGYEAVREHNPQVIYCAISGYGRDTPYADRPGYDFVLQAECGFMAITGEPAGEPMRLGVAFVDLLTGANASQAILAALFARERTGCGQYLDIALFDSGLQALANVATGCLNTGAEAQRYGNAHPSIVPYQLFTCGDGQRLAVAVGNDEQYQRLCTAVLDSPQLASDARFRANRARTLHRAVLIPELQRQFSRFDAATLVRRMQAADIPVGEVRSVKAALASAESVARGCVAEVTTPGIGALGLVQSPLRFSATPVRAPLPPPRLGEHTAQVLQGVLGLGTAELDALIADGTLAST